MGVLDFFGREAGQSRTRALQGLLTDAGDAADYYLGPTGVPDKVRGLLGAVDAVSPVSGTLRSMDKAGRGDYVGSAAEAASVLAPAAVAKLAGPIAGRVGNVLSDTLTGFNGSVGEAAARSYMLGDKLSPQSGYVGAANKPSTVGMPDGSRYDAKPINAIEQSARDYMKSVGIDARAFDEYPEFSEERARLIAAAYDMMPNDPSNPLVKRSYEAMIDETLGQYKALKDSGIEFKFLREGMKDPYAASPALGYKDLVENGRLFVYPTDFGFGTNAAFDPSTNPLLKSVGRVGDKSNAVANDAFRAVHDAFGHFGGGNPFFRRQGEERAFLEHSRMYSPEARGAMTSETRGQNSWVNSGPFGQQNRTASGANTVFADQKAGLMPQWTGAVRGMPDQEEMEMLKKYIEENKWR